jgi:Ran GTPase-activating protein (RanGAP) involved in mRNA processing and transport
LEINLWGNYIGAEGAQYLADVIKSNSTLLKINLYNNKIGNEGAKDLTDAIKLNSTLQKIYLEFNNIGYDLESQIYERTKESVLRKEMNYRKYVCAFHEHRVGSFR